MCVLTIIDARACVCVHANIHAVCICVFMCMCIDFVPAVSVDSRPSDMDELDEKDVLDHDDQSSEDEHEETDARDVIAAVDGEDEATRKANRQPFASLPDLLLYLNSDAPGFVVSGLVRFAHQLRDSGPTHAVDVDGCALAPHSHAPHDRVT